MPIEVESSNAGFAPKHTVLDYALGFRELLKWFSEPALLLTLGAMMAIAAGAAGALGLPSLIWHDSVWVQIWAGSALMFLALSVGVTGFLLDHRGTASALQVTDLFLYASRPAFLMAVAVLFGWLSAPRPHGGLGVGVGLLPPMLLALVLWRRHRGRLLRNLLADTNWLANRFGSLMHALHLPIDPAFEIAPTIHVIHALFFGFVFVLYLLARLPSAPAIAAVTLVLILANGVIGFLSFWLGRYGTLVAYALAIATLGFSGVRDALPPGVTQVALQRTAPPGRLLSDDEALGAWLARTTAGQPAGAEVPPPLVVVATSGGGIRASLWTVVVLNGLDAWIGGFRQHVRLITGASGGMVGAAHYVSALARQGMLASPNRIADAAAQDSLSAVAQQLLSFSGDRGRALEAAWEEASDGRLAQSFASLREGEAQDWRPSLVFTPTIVEDGRRLLISNLDLGALLEQQAQPVERKVDDSEVAVPSSDAPSSVSGLQLFAGPGDAMAHLKLSTAARMNATFPWVTSAIELPSTPIRRVVDAGYYDNYGVDISSLWLQSHRAWIQEHHVPVVLIQIRDGQEHDKRTQVDKSGPSWAARLVSPLSAPIETFLSTREASMSFRNDELLNATEGDPTLLADNECTFATAVFELPEQAPLSWYLDAATRQAMQASIPGPTDSGLDPTNAETTVPDRDRLHEARDRNRKTLGVLKKWWTDCTTTGAP